MLTAKVTLAIVGTVLVALAFFPARRHPIGVFIRAIGLVAMVALPVGIAQSIWVIGGGDFPDLITRPLAAVPFNAGGLVCAAAHESIDRAGLIPPRQTTVHPGVYMPLLLAWQGALAGLIAERIHRTGQVLSDARVQVILGVALANSVLGVTWPWWGS